MPCIVGRWRCDDGSYHGPLFSVDSPKGCNHGKTISEPVIGEYHLSRGVRAQAKCLMHCFLVEIV